jgi:hypothetical protein
MELNSEKIFTGYVRDSKRGFETEKQEEVFKDLCENHTLRILSSFLESAATIENICAAKIKFIRACLEEGWVNRIFNTNPKCGEMGMGFVTPEEDPEVFSQTVTRLISAMEEITSAYIKIGNEEAIDKTWVLKRLGVSEQNAERIISGELSIGEILMSQPIVILQPLPE